jgi:hypothetical protein
MGIGAVHRTAPGVRASRVLAGVGTLVHQRRCQGMAAGGLARSAEQGGRPVTAHHHVAHGYRPVLNRSTPRRGVVPVRLFLPAASCSRRDAGAPGSLPCKLRSGPAQGSRKSSRVVARRPGARLDAFSRAPMPAHGARGNAADRHGSSRREADGEQGRAARRTSQVLNGSTPRLACRAAARDGRHGPRPGRSAFLSCSQASRRRLPVAQL